MASDVAAQTEIGGNCRRDGKRRRRKMLLSEMLGVELDKDFRVKGYETRFRLTLNVSGFEHLKIKRSGSDVWETPLTGTIFNVISVAPSGIIHLLPPLTDEQREQLRALYTLGYRWITRDKYGSIYVHEESPCKKAQNSWLMHLLITKPAKCFESLVTYPSPEPYDIAKALGVGK